jgi:hypothetical protein
MLLEKMALGDVRTQIPETKYEIAAKPLSPLYLDRGRPQKSWRFGRWSSARYLDNL